jgi:hypothetical protein
MPLKFERHRISTTFFASVADMAATLNHDAGRGGAGWPSHSLNSYLSTTAMWAETSNGASYVYNWSRSSAPPEPKSIGELIDERDWAAAI